MAITMINTPADLVYPAYVPIVYEGRSDRPEWEPTVNLVIELWVNGAFFRRIIQEPFANTKIGATIRAEFEFDVSNLLQEYMAPFAGVRTSGIGRPGDSSNIISTDSYLEFHVDIYEEYNDGTKLVLDVGSQVTTTRQAAINAVRQRNENQTLDAYWANGSGQVKLLTNKPFPIDVCLGDSEFFGLLGRNINAVRIAVLTDNPRTFINWGAMFIGAGGGIAPNITIGLGPRNINNIVAARWIIAPDWCLASPMFDYVPVTIDPATQDLYIIQYGMAVLNICGLNFSPVGTAYQFNLAKCCETNLVFHFLNAFGKGDTFRVKTDITEIYQSKSGAFQKPLDNFQFREEDRGNARIDIRALPGFKAKVGGVTEDKSIWLKELYRSSEVYLEIDDVLIPVIVKDGKSKVIETAEPLDEFIIEVTFSNSDVIQRN